MQVIKQCYPAMFKHLLSMGWAICSVGSLAVVIANSAMADERNPPAALSTAQINLFEGKIRPLLIEHCYDCHGPDSDGEAGLRVDSRRALLRGGDSGAAIVPSRPQESLLIDAINYGDIYHMPPDGKLPQSQIDLLTQWVASGALWPGSENDMSPEPEDTSPSETGVLTPDRTSHWSFQPMGNYEPPTVQRTEWAGTPIDRFILKAIEDAQLQPAPQTDKLTLLRRVTFDLTGLPPTLDEITSFMGDESPRAFAGVVDRLLDSPHYGERWGRHWLDVARYADAAGHESDFAYRLLWRYRDYVIDAFNNDLPYDQFIVEQLAGDLLPKTDDLAENLRQTIATGFLQVGPKPVSERDKDQMFLEIVDEQLNATGSAFMGLTLGCARCHDHKFDPVPTLDYYSLAGIFMSTRTMADTLPDSMWVEFPMDGPDGPVPVMGVTEQPKPANMNVYLRGNYKTKGVEAPRRFLQVIAGCDHAPIKTSGSGRLELARWIASPDHPLTARVMVNRIWQHHFGNGLVATSDNFGLQGSLPSHPELLDYLAQEFVRSGWSIKHMHRLLLNTSTYQQAHVDNPAAEQIDPENRLLWRMPRRRLSTEEIRDSMLAISRELDPSTGGSILLYRDGWGRPRRYAEDKVYKVANYGFRIRHQYYPSFFRTRRSIYLPRPRLLESEFSALFDGPNSSLPEGKRDESTVAPQSLFFINSHFANETTRQYARHLLACEPEDTERMRLAYWQVLNRGPDADELRRDRAFLREIASDVAADMSAPPLPDIWASYESIVRQTGGLLGYYKLDELHEREHIAQPHIAINSASPGRGDGKYCHQMTWRLKGKTDWPDGIFNDVAFGRWGAIDLDAPMGRRNTAVGFNIPFEWPFDDDSDTGVDRGHRLQVDDTSCLDSHTGLLTVELWLQPINLWPGTVIARHNSASDQCGFRIGVEVREVDGKQQNVLYYEFGGSDNGGRRTVTDPKFVIPAAQWTHVAMTFGDGKRRLIINGELADECSVSGELEQCGAPLTFAALPDQSDWYAGIIDEVAIYNRVLDQQQLRLRVDAATGALYKRHSVSAELQAWTVYCQALLASNEFIFVD